MELIFGVIALFSIIAFIISLGTDPLDGLLTDFLPEKVRKLLRWTLGVIAFISITAYIFISLKN